MRNKPCACGSGLKYKKCCLRDDEAAHMEKLRPAPKPVKKGQIRDGQMRYLAALYSFGMMGGSYEYRR